jgi:hypothetical protein
MEVEGRPRAEALVQPLLMRFTNPGREEADRDRRRATCCKALLVLSTPRDGTAEWIAAGEALQRILLRAAAAGLYASSFAQPIENQDLRRRLGDVLAHPGIPQVMFRLGYGLDVRPVPRRPVDEVLRRMEVEAGWLSSGQVPWGTSSSPHPMATTPGRPLPSRSASRKNHGMT